MRAIKRQVTLKKLIIIAIIAIFAFNYVKQSITLNRIEKEIIENQNELENLKSKNNELESDLKKVDTDEYIEKLARERLGMIKDGEKVVNFEKQN